MLCKVLHNTENTSVIATQLDVKEGTIGIYTLLNNFLCVYLYLVNIDVLSQHNVRYGSCVT